MRLLLTAALIICFANAQAQITLNKTNVIGGTSYTQWDGWFDQSPATYKPLFGYFIGGVSQVKVKPSSASFFELGLSYRNMQTKRRKEVIKLDEIVLSFGPNLQWKKLSFGLNTSMVYVISKKKISNATPGLNLKVSDIEAFYASLSGKIQFNITPNVSIFVEQSIINTRIYKYLRIERGQIYEAYDYPQWTLLGFSYTLLSSQLKGR